MPKAICVSVTLFTCLLLCHQVGGQSFRGGNHGAARAEALGQDLIHAMDEVLGCGARSVDPQHLSEIERVIVPMWKTMPKEADRLDWKSVRYIAHRYFMQQSSLVVRGFEPSRLVSETDSGAAEVLSKEVPAHADVLFGGTHKDVGYTLEDTIKLLAALERLVFDSESALLEQVYDNLGVSHTRKLSQVQILRVLEMYMMNWMIPSDNGLLNISFNHPHFDTMKAFKTLPDFIAGRVRTLDYKRAIAPQAGQGNNLMLRRYSFDDAHEVVGGITQSFQSYWEDECQEMKRQLVEMDGNGDGRVRLSDFYGTGLDKDWRFAESEAYLRDLGVLDESSRWRGKQVMIANYLQAASNCIVSAPNYLVCCTNECEVLMGAIESAIGEPTGTPEQILEVVSQLSSPSSAKTSVITSSLKQQLFAIAGTHGGTVALHGRLFAQWLHYAFPRECPFPHKSGEFASHTLSPDQYGGDYMASKVEMNDHASQINASFTEVHDQHSHEWNQWSAEEELFADYSTLRAPWEERRQRLSFSIFVVAAALVGMGLGILPVPKFPKRGSGLPFVMTDSKVKLV